MPRRVKYARQDDLELVMLDVKDIRNNDLKHLAKELKHLSRNVFYLMGAVAVILVFVGAILSAVLIM